MLLRFRRRAIVDHKCFAGGGTVTEICEGFGPLCPHRANMSRMHAGLSEYLRPSHVTDISAPPSNARHEVLPGESIPPGSRPIPASSEQNKKSNATIVYAREAVPIFGPMGMRGVLEEGQLAFVERVHYGNKRNFGANSGTSALVRAKSMESVNEALKRTPFATAPTFESFPYAIDGVVNNVDGEDKYGEYRDQSIANVAIAGPVRYATPSKYAMLSGVFCGLFEGGTNTQKSYTLVAFSSSDARNGLPGGHTLQRLVLAWKVGSVVDTSQSTGFVTICVAIDRIYCQTTMASPRRMLSSLVSVPEEDPNLAALLNAVKSARIDSSNDGTYEHDGEYYEWCFRASVGGSNAYTKIPKDMGEWTLFE